MTESLSIKYSKVQWVYTQQKIGGGMGGKVPGSWNLSTNQKA
jgi:type VI secretion system secreted protein Hcp